MDDIVSVIIPVYNTAQYLDVTINSVIGQIYSNIEIILVDDGSTDGSGIICDDWSHKDNRIKVIHTSNNGPSKARNIGIENSNGKYILPVDSDDMIGPTYVKKAVAAILSRENIGIVYCQSELFGDETGKWNLPTYTIQEILITNCIFSTALFKKSDWEKVGGYSNEMRHGIEDYDFWLALISIGVDVYQIPEVLFYYRKREDSRTLLFESNDECAAQTRLLKYYRHRDLYMQYYRVLDRGKRIALYGAGGAGINYLRFLLSVNHNNIVCCVDKNFEKLNKDGFDMKIISPDDLYDYDFDAIVIAINNLDVVRKIKDDLKRKYNADVYWYFKGQVL